MKYINIDEGKKIYKKGNEKGINSQTLWKKIIMENMTVQIW